MDTIWFASTLFLVLCTTFLNCYTARKVKNGRHYFHPGPYFILLSICLCNLACVPLVMFPHLIAIFKNEWIFGRFTCQVYAVVFHFVQHFSSLSLTSLIVERAIRLRPLFHRGIFIRNSANFLIVFSGAFCSAMLATFPVIGWGEYDFVTEENLCTHTTKGFEKHVKYFYFLILTWIFTPSVAIVFYVCIRRVVSMVDSSQQLDLNMRRPVALPRCHGVHCVSAISGGATSATSGTTTYQYRYPSSSNLASMQGDNAIHLTNSQAMITPTVAVEGSQIHTDAWYAARQARLAAQTDAISRQMNARIQAKLRQAQKTAFHEPSFSRGAVVTCTLRVLTVIPQFVAKFCLAYRLVPASSIPVFIATATYISQLHAVLTPCVLLISVPAIRQEILDTICFRKKRVTQVRVVTERPNYWIANHRIDPYEAEMLRQIEETV